MSHAAPSNVFSSRRRRRPRSDKNFLNVQVWQDQIEKCTNSNTPSENVTEEAQN